MKLTQRQMAGLTGGVLSRGSEDAVVERLSTDTRAIQRGDVFLALKGPRFNGEEFCHVALENGAEGLVVSHEWTPDFELPANVFILRVADTEVALTDLARSWREIVDPRVIAITGSAGKTTTKEMLQHICCGFFRTHATKGNKNNHIGLPLTLLDLREDHELAVIETGMNHSGELRHLASVCLPDIAVVTNIGSAHLGNFKGQDDVARAKGELVSSLPGSGIAVLNADCAYGARFGEFALLPPTVVTFGQRLDADVRADRVGSLYPYGYHFQLRIGGAMHPVELKVFGRCQISNALAAAAAAHAAGIAPEQIAERLSTFSAPSMRCQIERWDGALIVHDYYNASPEAVLASVRSLRDLEEARRRIFLFGDMLELGDHSEKFHREIGDAVAEESFDMMVTVGTASRESGEAARRRGMEVAHFTSPNDAGMFLAARLREGDGLLIKGSRGMRLEEAVTALHRARHATTGVMPRV